MFTFSLKHHAIVLAGLSVVIGIYGVGAQAAQSNQPRYIVREVETLSTTTPSASQYDGPSNLVRKRSEISGWTAEYSRSYDLVDQKMGKVLGQFGGDRPKILVSSDQRYALVCGNSVYAYESSAQLVEGGVHLVDLESGQAKALKTFRNYKLKRCWESAGWTPDGKIFLKMESNSDLPVLMDRGGNPLNALLLDYSHDRSLEFEFPADAPVKMESYEADYDRANALINRALNYHYHKTKTPKQAKEDEIYWQSYLNLIDRCTRLQKKLDLVPTPGSYRRDCSKRYHYGRTMRLYYLKFVLAKTIRINLRNEAGKVIRTSSYFDVLELISSAVDSKYSNIRQAVNTHQYAAYWLTEGIPILKFLNDGMLSVQFNGYENSVTIPYDSGIDISRKAWKLKSLDPSACGTDEKLTFAQRVEGCRAEAVKLTQGSGLALAARLVDRSLPWQVRGNYWRVSSIIESPAMVSSLIWSPVTPDSLIYVHARAYCEKLKTLGLRWRLPSAEEIREAVKNKAFLETLPKWFELHPQRNRKFFSPEWILKQSPSEFDSAYYSCVASE